MLLEAIQYTAWYGVYFKGAMETPKRVDAMVNPFNQGCGRPLACQAACNLLVVVLLGIRVPQGSKNQGCLWKETLGRAWHLLNNLRCLSCRGKTPFFEEIKSILTWQNGNQICLAITTENWTPLCHCRNTCGWLKSLRPSCVLRWLRHLTYRMSHEIAGVESKCCMPSLPRFQGR